MLRHKPSPGVYVEVCGITDLEDSRVVASRGYVRCKTGTWKIS